MSSTSKKRRKTKAKGIWLWVRFQISVCENIYVTEEMTCAIVFQASSAEQQRAMLRARSFGRLAVSGGVAEVGGLDLGDPGLSDRVAVSAVSVDVYGFILFKPVEDYPCIWLLQQTQNLIYGSKPDDILVHVHV